MIQEEQPLLYQIEFSVENTPVQKEGPGRSIEKLDQTASIQVGTELTQFLSFSYYGGYDLDPLPGFVGDDLVGSRLYSLVGIQYLEVGIADHITYITQLGPCEG